MGKNWKMGIFVAILAGIAMMGLASPAQAQFRMRVEDVTLGVGVVITDQLPPDMFASGPGSLGTIVYAGAVGNFNVTVNTGLSKPAISGSFADLDLTFTVSTTTGGTLRVTLEDNGYTGGSPGPLSVQGTIGGTISGVGSVVVQSGVNTSNNYIALGADTAAAPPAVALGAIGGLPAGTNTFAFAQNVAIGPTTGQTVATSASSTASAFNASGSAGFTATGAYALYQQALFTFAGTGLATGDLHTQVLPGPGGLALALTALPGFGLAWLRRRFKKA